MHFTFRNTAVVLAGLLLVSIRAFATPSITHVSFPASVGKYHKFEVDFDLNSYLNPYDFDEIDVWAEMTAPSGKTVKVYAFYYEGYVKLDDGSPESDEVLAPSGINGWKLRLSPNEIGTWTFKIHAADSIGETSEPATDKFSFMVTPSGEKGFISLANSRYLKYDSGDPYIPIGDSYPWWLVSPWRAASNGTEKGTNIMRHYLDGMAANGFSYNRFEINFFEGLSLIGRDFVLQKTFCKYYNQHDAWQLDAIMDYSKMKGISLNLALFAHSEFGDDGGFWYLDPNDQDGQPDFIPEEDSKGKFIVGNSFGNWSLFNPFNANQDIRFRPALPDENGTSVTPYDFFTNPASIVLQQKLFRYVVARWGYCTNLMGFELIDEAESIITSNGNNLNPHYVPPPSDWIPAYAAWHAKMYDYLKKVDPNRHLISSAVSSRPELIRLVNPKMDFMNIHWYSDYGDPNPGVWQQPFEYSIKSAIEEMQREYDKPYAIMEMGWWNSVLIQDPKLYELHNLIWSALFNGSMGLSAIWAHEHEVLQQGALNHFLGVGTYSKLLPPLSEAHISKFVKTEGLKWEYLHDPIHDEFYGWVQDENFTFLALRNGYQHQYLATFDPAFRPSLSSEVLTYELPIHRHGTYRVSWYNTETGALHSSEQVVAKNGSVQVTMPRDLRMTTWADAGFTVKFITGASNLLVYPNPSNGTFQIIPKHPPFSNCSYAVYSALGSCIMKKEVALDNDAPSFEVDLEGFSAGIYYLVVSIGDETISHRLDKQ